MKSGIRLALLSAIFGLMSVCGLVAAQAGVVAKVSISRQQMVVYVDGFVHSVWPVSTGRAGYSTPHGSYGVKRMARMHYSRKYDNSPMPYSIFFRGGYAVHGTGYVRSLGRRASHGCVRLAPGHAAELYSLVQSYGPGSARIVIGG